MAEPSRIIQVGDHSPEPTSPKHYAVRKMRWSVEEYRALAERFSDAAQRFQIAVANESFAGLVSAYHDFHEIAHQTGQLNVGLERAITEARGFKR